MKKIIVEFCQNFIGDKEILRRMIDAAARFGATHAKIQSYLSGELTPRPEFELGDGRGIDRPYLSEFERLKKSDLTEEDIKWFIEECKLAGIKPLITIFTRARAKTLGPLDWDEIKIASYDCASLPLISDLKPYFNHFYISTGATFDDEIRKTANLMKGTSFSFLHCVTKYPTKLEDLNLARLGWLRQFTSSVGYSDHSLVAKNGILASLGALALGADVIERHFTILESDKTKDGPISITPQLLKELVSWSKKEPAEIKEHLDKVVPNWQKIMLGSENREPTEEELRNRHYYRGRFASRVGNEWVYNWEDKAI